MIKDLILEGTPHYKFEFRNQKYVRVDRHQQLFILSNPKSRRLVMSHEASLRQGSPFFNENPN